MERYCPSAHQRELLNGQVMMARLGEQRIGDASDLIASDNQSVGIRSLHGLRLGARQAQGKLRRRFPFNRTLVNIGCDRFKRNIQPRQQIATVKRSRCQYKAGSALERHGMNNTTQRQFERASSCGSR